MKLKTKEIKDPKQCPVCEDVKALTEYQKKASAYDGHHARCTKCSNKIRRKRYATDPEVRAIAKRRSRNYKQAQLTHTTILRRLEHLEQRLTALEAKNEMDT